MIVTSLGRNGWVVSVDGAVHTAGLTRAAAASLARAAAASLARELREAA